MKKLLTISLLIWATSCKDDVSEPDTDWTRYLYEISDIAAVSIVNDFTFELGFPNKNYRFQSITTDFEPFDKSIGPFTAISGRTATALGSGSRVVFGGIDPSSIFDPEYTVKLVDTGFETRSIILNNVEETVFLPNDAFSFYGVLRSPLLQDQGSIVINVTIFLFTDNQTSLDTTRLAGYTIPIDPLKEITFDAAKSGDQVYFALQSSLNRFEVSTSMSSEVESDRVIKRLIVFDNQLYTQTIRLRLDIYDLNLNAGNPGFINLENLGLFDEDLDAEILNLTTRGDRAYVVAGISQLQEIKSEFSDLVGVSIDVLSFDNNWNEIDRKTVLEGSGLQEGKIWEDHTFMSMDVLTDRYGIFVFKKEVKDTRFEYLIRRVNF